MQCIHLIVSTHRIQMLHYGHYHVLDAEREVRFACVDAAVGRHCRWLQHRPYPTFRDVNARLHDSIAVTHERMAALHYQETMLRYRFVLYVL